MRKYLIHSNQFSGRISKSRSVSVCLMNRLMMNLRRQSCHYHEDGTETAETTLTNANYFSTHIVGNLTSELIFTGDSRGELDAYYGSRGGTNWFGPSESPDWAPFTNTQVSAPSAARSKPSNYFEPTNPPQSHAGDDDGASSSRIGPCSNAIVPGSNSTESPTISIGEYALRAFASGRPMRPLSNETCVGSLDLESMSSTKLPEHQDDVKDCGDARGNDREH